MMTYVDLIEIIEYLDTDRKAKPDYTPTEGDQQRQLLDFIASQAIPPEI